MTPLTHRSNFYKNPTHMQGARKVIAYFEAEVLTPTDYYTFGAVMPERHWSAGAEGYRYGFNDDEPYGKGNALDFGARIYDSRLGRWLSVDPLEKKTPGISAYHYSFCSPLMFNDPDGKSGRFSITRASAKERERGIGGTIVYETVVHLYGADASVAMANQYQNNFDNLNNTVTVTLDGAAWTVIVHVKYVYNQALDQAVCANGGEQAAKDGWLNANQFLGVGGISNGDNIMLVDRTLTDVQMCPSCGPNTLGINFGIGGNSGKVRGINTPAAAIHETGHMLGLDERYNPTLGGIFVSPHPGFGVNNRNGGTAPLDIMVNTPTPAEINPVHFYDFARVALNEMTRATNAERKTTGKLLMNFNFINNKRVDDTNLGRTQESPLSVGTKRAAVTNQRRTTRPANE